MLISVDHSVLPVFSKVNRGKSVFFVPCPEYLSVSGLVGPAVSEWASGQPTGPATDKFIGGLASSLLAGGEFGAMGNVPCLLHTVRSFNDAISELAPDKLDGGSYEGVTTAVSTFAKSLALAWRKVAASRRSISPPRIFQAMLRGRLAFYGQPPSTLEEKIEFATNALTLNVDAVLLSDLHRALVLVARNRSVEVTSEFVTTTLPKLHECIDKRELLKAGFSKVSSKQLVRQKSIHGLTPFYLKVREAVAGWEAISALVGVTSVLKRGNTGLVCGKVSLPDSLNWSLYMGSALAHTRVHRVRLDGSKLEGDLCKGVANGVLTLAEGSAHLASLTARFDRAYELTVENDGLVLSEGSIYSLCFRDGVTAKGALKRCQQMFKPPFSLSGVIGSDYLVPSASLPKVSLDGCDIYGGVFGDFVSLGIVEVKFEQVKSDVSPVIEENSGGMDLLTERVSGDKGPSKGIDPLSVYNPVNVNESLDRASTTPATSDPWGDMGESVEDVSGQPVSELEPAAFSEQDPWGDLVKAQPVGDSNLDPEQFFLAPPAVNRKEAAEASGSLGVSAETLSEVLSKHIVYREASGMLAFGMPASDSIVDYHVYQDNGDEVSAYVSFINDKYSSGFAPRSDSVSPLPVGEFSRLCDETIKVALGLCERQR